MSQAWALRPYAPALGTVLCALEDVPRDNGREVFFGEGEKAFRVVLFRLDTSDEASPELRAYINECPHFFIQYNFNAETFCVYEIDGQKDLMCAHHTAMFHLDDGRCYEGPCLGKRLIEVPVKLTNRQVVIG
jgi:nitrite reductase/ring-hydroxylating ferredoxin subunit